MQKSMIRNMTLAVLVVSLLGLGGLANAAAPSGPEILGLVDQTMGADSKVMSQSMTLISANGQERTREMKMWSKQNVDGDQMLARFLAPADVRGTGILMNSEDMWLYLPALGRVRRVASHAKKGSFMGSDLSFDDMEQLGSKGFSQFYEPTFLSEQTLEDSETLVLKLTALSNDTDYVHLKMWVDQKIWLPRKIEYFGENNVLLKTLTTWDLIETEDRWIAQKMIMEDNQKGTRTILTVKEVSFSETIDDSIFTTRNLERGM